MIYENVISTGDYLLSGCSSSNLGSNTSASINLTADGAANMFYYDRSVSTGQREIQLFLNGQTLLQEIPIKTETPNETIYQIKTGDFFTKTASAPVPERGKLNFEDNVLAPYASPVDGNSKIRYNIVTGGIFAATGNLGYGIGSSINAQYSPYDITDYDFFLNGQKVYSGHGIGITAGGIQFGIGSNIGGVVTAQNETKFKYTAYRKRVRTAYLTGSSSDLVSSTGFIEGRSTFYINGIEQPQESYLELYSGVTIIKPQFSAVVSGGKLNNAKTEESLIL